MAAIAGALSRSASAARRDDSAERNKQDHVRFRAATAFVQTERPTFCRWACNNSLTPKSACGIQPCASLLIAPQPHSPPAGRAITTNIFGPASRPSRLFASLRSCSRRTPVLTEHSVEPAASFYVMAPEISSVIVLRGDADACR
jgi:hypothetical protein